MSDSTVIPFRPNGPLETPMVEWETMPAEELISDAPIQKGHEYINLPIKDNLGGRLTAGVWECTPFETVMAPYSVHEFMHVLEGSVCIVDQFGQSQTFRQGDSFVIPKGTICSWKQTEYIRKFYVIFEDNFDITTLASNDLAAIRIDTKGDLPELANQDPEQFIGSVPTMHQRNDYTGSASRFIAGVWDSTAMTRVPGVIGRSELMHILEGSGSIINGDGVSFSFSAGDTFLVPMGMGYQWHSDEYVKKVFCTLIPES